MMRELSLKEKIAILDQVISDLRVARLFHRRKPLFGALGLCYLLAFTLAKYDLHNPKKMRVGSVETVFPLFTYKNALNFGARDLNFWWTLLSEPHGDYKHRIKFLKWIRKEMKKELNIMC